ncbi:hypothetical protein DV451_001390 [Geotrichum candidum]|uniref:Uncharacterized protein n=1 Tax=Geotrichum candidum TaxID=1173061 RepID=A0A9P5G869_GEOCN|nr:hypothetical protein DV451_001390 [Geotrichum candidum]
MRGDFSLLDFEYRRIQRKYGKRRPPTSSQNFPSSSNVEISHDRSEIQRRIAENTPTATIRNPVSAPVATMRKSASMINLPGFGRRRSSASTLAAAPAKPDEQRYDGKIANQYRKSSLGSVRDRKIPEQPPQRSMSVYEPRAPAPASRRASYIDPGSIRQAAMAGPPPPRRLSVVAGVTGSLPMQHSKSTTQLPTHYEYSLSTEIDRESTRFWPSIDDADYHYYQRQQQQEEKQQRRISRGRSMQFTSPPASEFTFQHPQNFDLAQQQQQQQQQKSQSFLSRKLSLLVGH